MENYSWTKILLILVFAILFLIIVFYILSLFIKIPNQIKEKFTTKHVYLLLFIFPIFYLVYFHLIYNKDNPDTYIISGPETLKYLYQISLILVGSGIFSATSKYINNLVVFKEHFEKVIMSDKFKKLITEKLTSIPFSDEHLSQVDDIHKMWKKITLFRYQQVFPELMNKLEKKLINDLLTEINSYYKNFKIQINIELIEPNVIKINEITSVTLIPKSTEDIPVNFWISTKDDGDIYSKFIPEKTKINGKNFDIATEKDIELTESTEDGMNVKHYKFNLKDCSEYHIEREIELTQNLDVDRLYTFASAKVIDDISIHIQYCDKLNVFFSGICNNKFRTDNLLLPGKAYINRDVLLPGDVFNLFILKK